MAAVSKSLSFTGLQTYHDDKISRVKKYAMALARLKTAEPSSTRKASRNPKRLPAARDRRVSPVTPAAAYIGGKRQLSARLVQRIEAVPHEVYAEPFIGMGGVFLKRRFAPKAEVMNDLSGDVATLFRVLQRHYVPLMDLMRFQFTSRREFDRLMATDPLTLTDLERAVRFLYLQRLAFGGKVSGRNFGVSLADSGRFDVIKLGSILADLNERLAGVVIENLPYAEMIARYDAPGTLFYLDPPYFGCETDYGKNMFGREDFALLADQLRGIKGKFILSINAVPEIREVFEGFDFETVDLIYTLNGAAQKDVQEFVISTVGLPTVRDRAPQLFDD
eukprot:gene6372-6439_t